MRLDIKYPKEYQTPTTRRTQAWFARQRKLYAEAEARITAKLGPKRRNIDGLRCGWGEEL